MGGILFTCPGFKQAVLERVDTLGFIPKETCPLGAGRVDVSVGI